MRVALFVPCYVDQLKPRVGLAALDLLEHWGFAPHVLDDPTCCGQPFLTAGDDHAAAPLAAGFARAAAHFDAIVAPSGSCVATLRNHLARLAPEIPEAPAIAGRCFELCEFLTAHDRLDTPLAPYPHRVALHASCHALRDLQLGTPSETRDPIRQDPARTLLERIPELHFVDLLRRDECCGFGGVFSVEQEAVSVAMGRDRLEDHERSRAEVVASTDVSCLIQLEGLSLRAKRPLRFLHVAEIFADALFSGADLESSGAREGHDGSRR